jgi:Tfp pilus assembly protein PilP
MKRRILLTLTLLASLACPAPAAQELSPWTERPGPVKNEELKRELLAMYKEDQAVRAPFGEGRQLTGAELRAISERDEADTKRLSEILDKYGFPGVKLVGIGATRAFVTMLLHSPSLELQKRALPHVERAARRKEIPPDDFAMLTDDALAHEHKPQLYGTNFKFVNGKVALDETEDVAHLDERRRKLGMQPIAVYAKFLAEMYKMPLDESSLPPPAPAHK